MLAGLLAAAGGTAPANAVQALGHDVAAWSTGWSWTYATTFRYQADGTDVTINENVTYAVAGVRDVRRPATPTSCNITGNITSGSGSAAVVPGIGTANLSDFSGNGERYPLRAQVRPGPAAGDPAAAPERPRRRSRIISIEHRRRHQPPR